MQKAYKYLAKLGDEVVESEMIADSEEDAFTKLKNKGLVPLTIDYNINDSFALLLKNQTADQSLAVFYRAFGLRQAAGTDPSLIARMLIRNQKEPRLRMMIAEMESFLNNGARVGEAMRLAGFPVRDCAIISAMDDAVRIGKTFSGIADDYERTASMKSKFRSMMFEPILIGISSVGLIWADLVFFVPKLHHFFKTLGSTQMPPYVSFIMNFGMWFSKNQPFASFLYFSLIIAIIFFVKSDTFKKSLMIIKPIKKLSVYSDNSRVWSGMKLLIDTPNDMFDSAILLKNAATRSDTQEALENFANITRGGSSPADAVEKSGFPEDIAMMASSAFSAPGRQAVLSGMEQLVKMLNVEVIELSDKVNKATHVLTLLLAAIMVVILASTTVLPMLLATISQV
jgi:type IV pilus assembly protein PilC